MGRKRVVVFLKGVDTPMYTMIILIVTILIFSQLNYYHWELGIIWSRLCYFVMILIHFMLLISFAPWKHQETIGFRVIERYQCYEMCQTTVECSNLIKGCPVRLEYFDNLWKDTYWNNDKFLFEIITKENLVVLSGEYN